MAYNVFIFMANFVLVIFASSHFFGFYLQKNLTKKRINAKIASANRHAIIKINEQVQYKLVYSLVEGET